MHCDIFYQLCSFLYFWTCLKHLHIYARKYSVATWLASQGSDCGDGVQSTKM